MTELPYLILSPFGFEQMVFFLHRQFLIIFLYLEGFNKLLILIYILR